MCKKKNYIFSEIDYKLLKEIIDIKQIRSQKIFNEWFNFDYVINKSEEEHLIKLIEANRYNLDSYIESQLISHFISPFLNKVYFYGKNYREWYQTEISAFIKEIKITGILDFMVASGTEEPEIPYFFITEFKKSAPIQKHPKGQLLAQMAVAIENNKLNKMNGAYNIGRFWFFVVLENFDGKYKYHESKSFDCLDLEHLKQIFINLKFIKHKITNEE